MVKKVPVLRAVYTGDFPAIFSLLPHAIKSIELRIIFTKLYSTILWRVVYTITCFRMRKIARRIASVDSSLEGVHCIYYFKYVCFYTMYCINTILCCGQVRKIAHGFFSRSKENQVCPCSFCFCACEANQNMYVRCTYKPVIQRKKLNKSVKRNQ